MNWVQMKTSKFAFQAENSYKDAGVTLDMKTERLA
jgi:hypothetical protein